MSFYHKYPTPQTPTPPSLAHAGRKRVQSGSKAKALAGVLQLGPGKLPGQHGRPASHMPLAVIVDDRVEVRPPPQPPQPASVARARLQRPRLVAAGRLPVQDGQLPHPKPSRLAGQLPERCLSACHAPDSSVPS